MLLHDVKHLVAATFPNRKVACTELLAGGLINTNLKISFESDFEPVVLRLYRDGAAVCEKEIAVHNLIYQHVPVPEILHAESKGSQVFAFVEYIQGLTFQQLKRTNNLKAIQQASASIGKTLAAIGRFRFPAPGTLLAREASLVLGNKFIEGPDPIPRLLDRFLASNTFQQRAGSKLVDQLHDFIWSYAPILPSLQTDCSLVHNDFGNRNILVREVNGAWTVAAVLDWEMAFSGSALLDVGNFLRYELDAAPLREPFFSRAFVEHGGLLPDNWKQVVKLIDLTGLVECLTHDELPSDVEAELFTLIEATLAMR
jgi:aminoglycoside phosphotransferase (APT) family kinase protein